MKVVGWERNSKECKYPHLPTSFPKEQIDYSILSRGLNNATKQSTNLYYKYTSKPPFSHTSDPIKPPPPWPCCFFWPPPSSSFPPSTTSSNPSSNASVSTSLQAHAHSPSSETSTMSNPSNSGVTPNGPELMARSSPFT
ncbi:hypothetical protein L6452_42255 [Arctium lappa]|uniref:Uncharacterized protein n=1 Tax=Arctium lappa TaxID=4217 RepID=A0ACB8XIX0_ARCLA|nr:hypothetical protein L6452_42255 [Arctium lappa]